MEHTIGIDFGTTKTLVSFYDPESKTNGYVRLGRGIDKMPTSIYVDEDGVWQFGDDADDYMSLSPLRYRRDFKLWLGKNAPYLVAKVEGTIHQFTAKDLAAKFLKHIKDQCEEMVFHEPVSSCTVTYPVAFSIAQREELKAAALEAGFERVKLLPEPEAAGYAYYTFGADKRLSKLMVVDWGGGTVDFAMVKLEGDEVSLVPNSYGGEVNVGGRKFDELLFTHLSRKIVQNGGTCLEDDGDPQLNKKVCSYKEQLSRVIAVKQVMLLGSKGVYRTELGRDEFDGVITPVVDRVVDQLKELLAKCTEKPEALLLIGGSSSVPFIRERLEAEIGLKCVVWDKLNEAVAIGAAWYGSNHIDSNDPSPANEQKQGLPNPKDEIASGDDSASSDMQRKCWKSGSELESYIRERKNAHDDFWYFIRSMIVTLWRLNPVHTSRMNFAEEIEKMAENEDPKVKSYRIRQGLDAIDFGDFDELVKNAADSVGDLLKEFLRVDDGYIKLYPELKAVAVGSKMSDFDDQALKNDVSMQLSQLKDDYTDICEKYKMLKDGYARYDEITAGGTSFLKVAINGALVYLTAGLWVGAIAAWSGWKHMSNKDFVQNYANALGEFGTTCDDFTKRGQDLLLKTVMQKQDLYGQVFEKEEVYLRALNAEGVDLSEVEKRIDEDEKPQNPQNVMEMSQMCSLALQVLREDSPISESRIQKLVEKLRRAGALLLADGTFDESAQQALVSVDKEAEERMTKFWKIVGKCEDCYGFYIGDDIPQKKLVNALREYATTLRLEDVLCLYDATFFGGGEDGFVITLDGLYWKNNDTPQSRSWDDMKSIFKHNGTSDEIMINGVDMKVPSGENETFETMFRELRDLLSQKKG